jgi:hypothetical protein
MSRPIAYNLPAAAINGSITNEDKVISYVVDGRGNDYFNNYESCNWVPSADGAAPIVFVTDTFTRGYEGDPNLAVPLFFACAGTSSAAILYTANRLPGSPGNYTNANDALVDLNKTLGYFILESNDPFQGINATDMAMDLDASKMLSYPQTGVSWFDLSGNGRNFTLVNGPVWNSNGWIEFDGADDRSTTSFGFLSNSESHEAWIYSKGNVSGYNMFMGIILPYYGFWQGNQYIVQDFIGGNQVGYIAGSLSLNRWYHFLNTRSYNGTNTTLTTYINGTLSNQSTYSGAPSIAGGTWAIGNWDVPSAGDSYPFYGDISRVNFYTRALPISEVKQNYFGSPIVTDGLVFAVDANNIVSYPKSGTAWYGLTGSINGTLVNGPTFNQENGGSIRFDGVDDIVTTGVTGIVPNSSSPYTVSIWCYRNRNDAGYEEVLSQWTSANSGNSFFFGFDNSNVRFTDNWNPVTVPGAGAVEVWINLVGVYTTTNAYIYLNGSLAATKGSGFTYTGVGPFLIGRQGELSSEYFNGKLSNTKIYNRALSSDEVQQNYQAEQYRFETPAGPVTNGLLLYWDAGNLDSYPGTGTTIYDLSGNGNNGTLYNGVGYNQVNGGVLTFDGVDDLVYLSTPNLSSTNNTVMGASRYSGGTRGRMINAYGNNWLVGNWSNSTENYYAEGSIALGVGPSDTNWRIYSALGDVSGDSYSLYVNNSLSAGPSNGGSAGPNGITVGGIGLGIGNGEYSTGQFSFVLVYNRLLTVAEMTQNYNFFKGRFGL